ncbi:hypothetical protein NKH36_06205 [Mesorhizobium sp. M1312]
MFSSILIILPRLENSHVSIRSSLTFGYSKGDCGVGIGKALLALEQF